ncbi:tetratricopeptide repeat protein [Nibricoccus aquaticus]|nr:tetratricopeptide repeat protein [Nibricoccus aquaticus]
MNMRLCLAVVLVGGFAGLASGGALKAEDAASGTTVATPPTSEAEIAAQVERVRTAGDFRNVEVAEEWEDFESENENLIGSVPRKATNFEKAIAKAKALSGAVDPKAVKAARAKVPEADDVAAYRGLALREAAAGNPDAAFCYLVYAHEADPKNADVLSDLAGALAMLGYANEALAILDELAKRGAVITPPMGLSSEDVLEYTRGYALLRLGEQAEARKKLETVRDRQPLLSEAPKLLSLLDAHEDKDPRKNFLLGVWRGRAKVAVAADVDAKKPEPDAFTEDEERENDIVAIDVRSWLDLGKGKVGVLPNVPYAANAKQANGLVKKFEELDESEEKNHTAILQKRNAIKPRKYVHTDTSLDETWGYRMETLVRAMDYRDPKLRALNQRMFDVDREIKKAWDAIKKERDDRADAAIKALYKSNPNAGPREIGEAMRPAYDAALGQSRGLIQKLDKAVRDRFAEWHLLVTALGGEVGDAKWREYIRGSIEAERTAAFLMVIHRVDRHARMGAVPFLEMEPTSGPGSKEEQGMGNCDGNQSVGISVNSLGAGEVLPFDLGVEATCEGLSLEAGVSVLPGLQISGEIGVDKKGGYSVFVGPKIDATVKGTGVAIKQGFTVSGSRGKGVTDFGAKIETKASVSVGAVSRSTKIGDQSMSFLPAPRGGPPVDLVPIGTK